MLNTKFTFLLRDNSDYGYEITLDDILKYIKDENSIRYFLDNKNKPSFLVSGFFKKKSDIKPNYSGLVGVEFKFNDLESVLEAKQKIKNDKKIFLSYTCSHRKSLYIIGLTDINDRIKNGDEITIEEYKKYVNFLGNYFIKNYGFNDIEKSSLDIKNKFYISFDKNYVFNLYADVIKTKNNFPKVNINKNIYSMIDKLIVENKTGIKKEQEIVIEKKQEGGINTEYENKEFNLMLMEHIKHGDISTKTIIYRINNVVKKNIKFKKGSRNLFVYLFAQMSFRAGIDEKILIKSIINKETDILFSSDFTLNEVQNIIKNVYKKEDGFGSEKWIYNINTNYFLNYCIKDYKINIDGLKTILDDLRLCYLIKDQTNANNNIYYLSFLKDNKTLSIENEDSINKEIQNRLLKIIDDDALVDEIILKSKHILNEKTYKVIAKELVINNDEKIIIFNNKILKNGVFYDKDEKTPLTFYFNMKNFNIYEHSEEEIENCVFARFLKLSCGDNYDFAKLIIGYLLNRGNNSVESRAVCIMDANTIYSDVATNGGTGKTLFCQALSYLINTTFFQMKNQNINSQFSFQNINYYTDLIVFNDIPKDLNFDKFYNIISDGFYIERKYAQPYYMPPSRGYKIIFTSNYKIPINGSSDKRRRFDLIFNNYFSDKHTPAQEFGMVLFQDFDELEWSRFYNFMAKCWKEYLDFGFFNLCKMNDERNIDNYLSSEIRADVIEFINDNFDALLEKKDFLTIKEAYDLYLEYCDNNHINPINNKYFSKYFILTYKKKYNKTIQIVTKKIGGKAFKVYLLKN